MRPIERIDDFIKNVDWNTLLYDRWHLDKKIAYNKLILYAMKPTVIEYWKNNPDQRIGQVLINLGIIPDEIMRWHDEEQDILIGQGIAPEECLYWQSLLDKDGAYLDEPIYRKISTLTKDHIHNIISYMEEHHGHVSPLITTAFQNVLNKE